MILKHRFHLSYFGKFWWSQCSSHLPSLGDFRLFCKLWEVPKEPWLKFDLSSHFTMSTHDCNTFLHDKDCLNCHFQQSIESLHTWCWRRSWQGSTREFLRNRIKLFHSCVLKGTSRSARAMPHDLADYSQGIYWAKRLPHWSCLYLSPRLQGASQSGSQSRSQR